MPLKDAPAAPAAGGGGGSNANASSNNHNASNAQRNNESGRLLGCRPFLWNPQDPNQLLLPSIRTAPTGSSHNGASVPSTTTTMTLEQTHAELEYEVALAEGGADCNAYELKALTRMLDAHANYHSHYVRRDEAVVGPPTTTPKRGGNDLAEATLVQLENLLGEYVVAIRDCLEGWDAAAHRRSKVSAPMGSSTDEDSMDLDPHSSSPGACDGDVDDTNNLSMLRYMYGIVSLSHTYLNLICRRSPRFGRDGEKLWDYPGLVSAGLVRFFQGTYPWLAGAPDAGNQMLDEFDGTPAPIDWALMRYFIHRGMLEAAWECLRRDPTYINAKFCITTGDSNDDPLRDKYHGIVNETEFIGLLLLVAPLPGCRGASSPGEDDGYVISLLDELGDNSILSRVRPSDARRWDAAADGYSHLEAARMHKTWQRAVDDYIQARKSHGDEVFWREFDPLLAVMSGKFEKIEFGSWADELCATILYKKPSMTPRQVSKCAALIAAKDIGDGRNVATSDMVPVLVLDGLFGVLNGSVGDAASALWSLGGSSSAALPSTITTLMYILYMEAKESESDGTCLGMEKTDLLCRTSTAIISSVDPMTSTLLSIQLMMPYALEDGSSELVEMIAALLERHSPADFSIANRLIELCRPLLERQAVDVMDGCGSLLLSCYRDRSSSGLHADAAFCLRKGVEVEALVLRGELLFNGSCSRELVGLCNRVVRQLADDFLSRDGFLSSGQTSPVIEMAEATINGLECQPSADLVSVIPAVRTLRYVVVSCRGGTSIRDRAGNLVACLRPEMRSNGRLRPTVAHHSLCWPLMQMANKILLAVEHRSNQIDVDPPSAFDLDGIAILMKQLADLRSSEQVKPKLERQYDESELASLDRILAMALKRAFVTKNRGGGSGIRQSGAAKLSHPGYQSFPVVASDKTSATVDRMLDG